MSTAVEPRVPAALRQELRALARKYGAVALVDACAELVRQLAVKGVMAELAKRRGESEAAEQCPRCRERAALLEETKRTLRGVAPPPPEGRPAAIEEENDA